MKKSAAYTWTFTVFKNCKGAFIVYVDGGYNNFEGGSLFFPTMIKGGCGKFPTKMTLSIGGGGADNFFS